MWVAFVRAAFGLGILGFLMWLLALMLSPVIDVATSGPHADAETVTQIGGWFEMMTVDNLTLIAGLAVALYLLSRAIVERKVTT